MPTYNYGHGQALAHIESLGMEVDNARLDEFDIFAQKIGLTQVQFTALVYAHAKLMKHYFTPSSYSYKNRIKIALYFLFSRK